jgi:hypothetical protein
MLKQSLKSVQLKGYDQNIDLEVNVLMITFTEGNLAVQYELKMPGEAGTIVKAGTTNITPPPAQLLAGLEATFKAMLPSMMAKLNE